MAYAERRERKIGVRYRGIYKAADGRYRSAGTFSTEERALAVALEAERHAEVAAGAAGGLDPGTRATRTIREYAPLFLRHHQVEGNTKDTYADTLRLHVIPFLGGCRLAETDRTVARNYITALQEEGRSANTIRQAKCRCEGCRQRARDYGRERVRGRRATASGEVRRRWERSRDADEAYLDEPMWNRIWARAVADSGIPFKPTAYQLRHTHASWLIDAGGESEGGDAPARAG